MMAQLQAQLAALNDQRETARAETPSKGDAARGETLATIEIAQRSMLSFLRQEAGALQLHLAGRTGLESPPPQLLNLDSTQGAN